MSLVDVREAITQAHHEEWARVVAALTRRFGDLDIAEEAAAEAFATAVGRWPADGVPPNPGAWLTTTANRKAIDRIRRESKRDDRAHASAACALLFTPVRNARDQAQQRPPIPARRHLKLEIEPKLSQKMRQAPLSSASPAAAMTGVSAGQNSGGCEIRTREGLPPTRFPSVRPRPLGESSAGKLTGPAAATGIRRIPVGPRG